MLRAVMRSVAAVVLGVLVAMLLIVGVEVVGAVLHPFPEGADTSDVEVVKAHVAIFPSWILALAVALWGVTAFVSPWVATRVGTGRHPAHGLVVGALLLLMVGFNMYLLPYPTWFEVANVVVFPVAIFFGVRLASRNQPAGES